MTKNQGCPDVQFVQRGRTRRNRSEFYWAPNTFEHTTLETLSSLRILTKMASFKNPVR